MTPRPAAARARRGSSRLAVLAVLSFVGLAHADDSGRFALSIGATTLANAPSDLDAVGLHLGGEASYHLGFFGPALSLNVERFGTSDPRSPTTWFVGLGAGLRAFLSRPKQPLAGYLSAQAVVLGTTNPVGTSTPLGSSFLGGEFGLGLEWNLPIVALAVAARWTLLSDGPELVTLALVLAWGSP
jgi:hypothetical protein